MNIVIPSYERHINYNRNFLRSFRKYCLDKKDVIINFICCRSNYGLFTELRDEFSDLNISIFTLSELILQVDNIEYDDAVKNFPTKYSLQSLKKLFSYSVVDSDYLVLDSENLCLKKFYLQHIFDILKSKKINYATNYYQPIQHEVVSNCNRLLNYENNTWCFLDCHWFFEKENVCKLVDELREINKHDKATFILKDNIFFEYQLYCSFLLKHSLRDKIEVKEILQNEIELQRNLDQSEHNYEYICSTLTPQTLDNYISLLNRLDDRITRLHWMPESFANKIIENTKVCIGTFHWDS